MTQSTNPHHVAKALVSVPAVLLSLLFTLTACQTSTPSKATPAGVSQTDAASASPAVPLASVLSAVKAAQTQKQLPGSLAVSLTQKESDDYLGKPFSCHAATAQVRGAELGECAYGSPTARRVMAIYGDSHAYMWAAALQQIALREGWQLRIFALSDCPVADLHFLSSETRTPSTVCDKFHSAAVKDIIALRPDVLFTTSTSIAGTNPLADGSKPTLSQWASAWTRTLKQVGPSGARLAFLGDIPSWQNDGPDCLAAHLSDLQSCAAKRAAALPPYAVAEQQAAKATKALYIDPSDWVCAAKCEPVINNKRVYNDEYHLLVSYAQYLSGSVEAAAQSVLK